jgi:DNA-directed RNA polymerase subunit RPC12/RpoP
MSAREKIAYLRGLIEGQNVADNVSMTKFHEALLGALDSIAEELDDIAGSQDDLREYVEDLEDDLMELRSELEPGLAGGHCGHVMGPGEEDGEEEYEATTCPLCGKDFFYRPDAYDEDEDLLCPHCGEPFKG